MNNKAKEKQKNDLGLDFIFFQTLWTTPPSASGDNALLNGRTMDYGPFGFVDRPFDQTWNHWEGDSERKFGFVNQPLAGKVVLLTL